MCCRYSYGKIVREDVERITGIPSSEYIEDLEGDRYPSMDCITIAASKGRLCPEVMKWGFPVNEKKQLIINARAETALQKRIFADSTMRRRCVLPADCFYEWDSEKNKATFKRADSSLMMLGIYNSFDLVNRFVILTTAANESMIKTHDRMPLIIDENRINDWIFDDDSVKYFLNAGSPMLIKHQEYEQLRFF